MSLTLITPPASEPVTLSEVKLQCGLSPFEDTDQWREQTIAEQIRSAITAARQYAESFTNRALITQTWTLTLDVFPSGSSRYADHHAHDITIPLPKFQALTAFTWLDAAGNVQDMLGPGTWGYQLVSGGDTRAAILRPPVFRYWPPTEYTAAEAVSITFTCGYGDTAAGVPGAIRNAIKIMAQHLFQNPTAVATPPAVDMLLAEYIVPIV